MYDTSLDLSTYLQGCPPRHIQPGPDLRFILLTESHVHLLAPTVGMTDKTAREAHRCLQSLHIEMSIRLPLEGQFFHCEWVSKDCVLVAGSESTWIGQWSNGQWKCVGESMCCSACIEEIEQLQQQQQQQQQQQAISAEPRSVSQSAPSPSLPDALHKSIAASTVLLENSSGSLYLLHVSVYDDHCGHLSFKNEA